MQLGIDLGTTRTIVAAVDRGNYPVVGFLDSAGDAHDHIPSVVGLSSTGELLCGFAAVESHDRHGTALLRSFKRVLASPTVTAHTPVTVGEAEFTIAEILASFTSYVHHLLLTSSTITEKGLKIGDVAVAVPAHAHGAQRMITLDAFRQGGFTVTAMLNEPSAAGFEYTHRQSRTLNSRRSQIVVYDLGGGTFDASLVQVSNRDHEVLASVGLNDVGGDDLDAILAGLALRAAEVHPQDLTTAQLQQLLRDCRIAKEALNPQSRRLIIPLPVAGQDSDVVVSVSQFYEAATPLVERTIAAMAPLIGDLSAPQPDLGGIAGIYAVGGSSALPAVPRALKARFNRRVHRSPYPASSTAIGLAIAVDASSGFTLTDRLSRGFGVFREGSGGQEVTFDPILLSDQRTNPQGDVVVTRRYQAAHTLGHFRFVEYSQLASDGAPQGQLVPFAEVIFPFTAALQSSDQVLDPTTVEHLADGPVIEERYVIDQHGIITVTITDTTTGFARSFSLAG